MDDAKKFVKDGAAGAASATIAKTIVAPVERVKLILQTCLPPEKRYKGIIDCFIRVPREQGFFSLWRGNLANVLRASAQESLSFAFKDLFKKWTLRGVEQGRSGRFVVGSLASAGLGSVAAYVFIHPLDFIRTRMAIDIGKGESREFRGFFHCVNSIVRSDGIPGIYRGMVVSMQYIFLYRGFYYGLFDASVPFAAMDGKKLGFMRALVIGQMCTIVAAVLTYPLDTVRRRMMMQAGRGDNVLYHGSVDCIKKILKNEGVAAFYGGFVVNAIRGVGAALILALYYEFGKLA